MIQMRSVKFIFPECRGLLFDTISNIILRFDLASINRTRCILLGNCISGFVLFSLCINSAWARNLVIALIRTETRQQ